MRLTIRKTNLQWSTALARHARRRARRGLRRWVDHIRSAALRVSDVNGRRGGEDKLCRLSVRLATGRELVVNSVATCPYVAVDGAIERLERAVRRSVGRARTLRRRGARR